jgi:predicted extracellular nuclease
MPKSGEAPAMTKEEANREMIKTIKADIFDLMEKRELLTAKAQSIGTEINALLNELNKLRGHQ